MSGIIDSELALVPLRDAIRPYGVTVRSARRKIREGLLAAAKPGRAYLVDPREVARLFAPTLRTPTPRPGGRESERDRVARQLARAGIVVGGSQ